MHTIRLPLHNCFHACQCPNRQYGPKRHCIANRFTKGYRKKFPRILKTPVRNLNPAKQQQQVLYVSELSKDV